MRGADAGEEPQHADPRRQIAPSLPRMPPAPVHLCDDVDQRRARAGERFVVRLLPPHNLQARVPVGVGKDLSERGSQAAFADDLAVGAEGGSVRAEDTRKVGLDGWEGKHLGVRCGCYVKC